MAPIDEGRFQALERRIEDVHREAHDRINRFEDWLRPAVEGIREKLGELEVAFERKDATVKAHRARAGAKPPWLPWAVAGLSTGLALATNPAAAKIIIEVLKAMQGTP